MLVLIVLVLSLIEERGKVFVVDGMVKREKTADTLTSPSVSMLHLDLLFATIGNLPTLYSTPWKESE